MAAHGKQWCPARPGISLCHLPCACAITRVSCGHPEVQEERSNAVQVCECQMVRYCTRTCQSRHWRVHKPICKAARQPGGITQDQALSFVHN